MLTILRTIYWFFYFAVSLVFLIPEFSSIRKQKNVLSKDEYETKINKCAGKWAQKQLKNAGVKVKVTGEENIPDGAVVFVSNHQGNFDIALFLACISKNKGYVAKEEMLKVPFIRSWMKELNCVFMDRSSTRQSLKAIIQGIEVLRGGYSLVIFPEGTRSKSDTIGDFKGGSFKLATKSKAPIVPVTVSGTYKIMEKNHNRIKPASVTMTIHKPIITAGLSKEEESALPETVKKIIQSAL